MPAMSSYTNEPDAPVTPITPEGLTDLESGDFDVDVVKRHYNAAIRVSRNYIAHALRLRRALERRGAAHGTTSVTNLEDAAAHLELVNSFTLRNPAARTERRNQTFQETYADGSVHTFSADAAGNAVEVFS